MNQSRGAPPTDQTLANRARERAKLAVRGALRRVDLEISRDPFSNRLARTLGSRGIETVMDVGANVGQYGALIRQAGYVGRIVSCEPLDGAFAELSRRAAGDPGWTTVQTAVGRAPGSTTINVSANSFSSSVLPMTEEHLRSAPGSGYIATQPVGVTTVEALAAQHGIDPESALLKIDTQGFEEEVLAGAGALLDSFAAVQLELSFVELYAGQRLFDELYAAMGSHGLRLQILEPGFSGQDGRMLQCDGLFVREGAG